MRFISNLTAGIVLCLVGLGLAVAGIVVATEPSDPDFDRLLLLIEVADREYDAAVALGDEQRPASQEELDILVLSIVNQFPEEGISVGRYPAGGISFQEYGQFRRNAVAGTYSPDSDAVALNARYLYDPVWNDDSYAMTLIHELVHAQGYLNEAQTETLSFEMGAALANYGYPGLLADFWKSVRGRAMGAAYLMAGYSRDEILWTTEGSERIRDCTRADACAPTVNQDRMDRLQELRAEVFTDEERRSSDKRVRYWLGSGRDYAAVLSAYSMRVMGQLLSSSCDDVRGDNASEPFTQKMSFDGRIVPAQDHLVRLDDVAEMFERAGACER